MRPLKDPRGYIGIIWGDNGDYMGGYIGIIWGLELGVEKEISELLMAEYSEVAVGDTWGIVKIMAPFWVP